MYLVATINTNHYIIYLTMQQAGIGRLLNQCTTRACTTVHINTTVAMLSEYESTGTFEMHHIYWHIQY